MNEGGSVSGGKWGSLRARMQELGIAESDLEERFILGSGHGGQKLNKTASCVDLLHRPTAIRVKCQQSRSRDMNRFLARRELCRRVDERVRGVQSERQQERERIRRQKRRRSRRQRQRMLADKRHHAGIKAQRRSIPDE